MARQLIDVAAAAGVDAVKFQTFSAEKLVTQQAAQAAYQEINTGKRESQYEMLKRLELTPEDFRELKAYAESKGLVFMSTPFDEAAIDFLAELDVAVFKSGSGELTNLPFLRHMAAQRKPMIVSTGMATLEEVNEAVGAVAAVGNEQLVLLHCTSNYPTPYSDANLNAMLTLGRETGALVGYSDHTEGITVPVIAVAMGATVLEKHFTLDRQLPGPDHKASLEPAELAEMVRQIRQVEQVKGSPEKKPTPAELEVASVARKSIVAAIDIPQGTLLDISMLTFKRPGTGIPPGALEQVIGRTITRDLSPDETLHWEDLA